LAACKNGDTVIKHMKSVPVLGQIVH
jgi:hypothetical protein